MKFVELLKDRNIPYLSETGHHHARQGWIQIDCPFCGRATRAFHMGYSIQGKYTHCWRCGGHQVVQTLMEMLDEPYTVCIKLVDGLETTRPQLLVIRRKLKLPKQLGPMQKAHRRYLKSRNFNPKILKEVWDLQGIGVSTKLAWRVFIPIKYKNQTVSWTTRAINKKFVRYISAPTESESLPHKSLLYGEDFVGHSIVVCEGPTDVWRIGPGAVATFGVNVSPAQVRKIAQYPIRNIVFDNEKIAQKRARVLSNLLSVFPGVTNNIILDAKDAGEASDHEINLIKQTLL